MKVQEYGVSDQSYAFFNTPSHVGKELFFYIISIGYFICDNKYAVSRNQFDSFLILYIKSGEGFVKVNNKTYIAKANDIIFLNCYQPHEYGTTSKMETLWIHFDGNFSKEYHQLICSRTDPVISMRDSMLIQDYLKTFLESFQNERILQESLVSCSLQRMLAEILILANQSGHENVKKNTQINDAISYIRENFRDKITLDDISSHINLSTYHFSRTFKREIGYSPYEYLTLIRINHSKFLLKNTKMRIKEIAFESGFNSESNFTTAFKTNAGITPRDFRDMPF